MSLILRELRDALLKVSLALPNGVAVRTSGVLDIGGQSATQFDFLLTVPALNAAQLPDGKTIKYDIFMSDDADGSSSTTYITSAVAQTGAGGVGCAAATFRLALPSNAKRYLFFKATGSDSGDASGASAMLEALF